MPQNPKVVLLAALVMASSVWFYMECVLIPYQEADAALRGRPRGILSDLYPRWLGARELLEHQRDPYSADVTREIQMGYYGRALDPTRPEDPKDEQRFAYPVYVVFLLAPLIGAPFPLARTILSWSLILLTALSVLLWLRFLRWRISGWMIAILLVLSVNNFAAVQGVKLQQLSLLVAGFLAASAALLASGQLFLAGVFLALATIKPQLAALPAAWLMLCTLSRWRERQNLFWGFGFTLVLLVGGGEYLLPGWIGKFIAGLVAYERYAGGNSLLDVLATRPGGTLLTLATLAGTAFVCWRERHAGADSSTFCLIFAFVLAVTVVVVPMTAPYNQVLLLPGAFLVVRFWSEVWQKGRLIRVMYALAALFICWPWLASLALLGASLFLPPTSLQRAWAVPLYTSLGIPLVVPPLLVSLLIGGASTKSEDAAPLAMSETKQ